MNIRCSPVTWPALTIISMVLGCFFASPTTLAQCSDCDGDGFTFPTDCNDAAAQIYPGQTETCNGFDDDCDGDIDEAEGCLRDCPYPDAQWPTVLNSLPGSLLGGHMAMAWSGSVIGLANVFDDNGTNRVRLSRLTPDGTLLGHTTLGLGDRRPSMVWTGDAFAVVWSNLENATWPAQFYLAQVDASGTLLAAPVVWHECDSGGNFAGECIFPRLAWSGDRFGIVWRGDGLFHLWFRTLDRAGTPYPGTLRLITDNLPNTGLAQEPYDIAAGEGVQGDGEFAIVWRERYAEQQRFRRLSMTSAPLSYERGIPMDGSPRLASAGNGWAVANDYGWALANRGDSFSLTLLNRKGDVVAGPTVADPPPGVHPGPVEDKQDFWGDLIWTGSRYARVVRWLDTRSWPSVHLPVVSQFDAGGLSLSTRRVRLQRLLSVNQPVAATWTGDRYMVAWELEGAGIQMGALLCDCSVNEDGDGSSSCSDCDDSDPTVWSYGMPLCDGINNNCYHGNFPQLANTEERDDDGDGFSECEADCDDTERWVYSGASERCDNLNNDCASPYWPDMVQVHETDDDGDGYTECDNDADCDDDQPDVHPFAIPLCDGLNNECNDPSWPDLAEDAPGGVCEVGGGEMPVVDLTITRDGVLHWQSASPFDAWNVYRGDRVRLRCDVFWVWNIIERLACRPAGGWVQVPGAAPLTEHRCNIQEDSLADHVALEPGQVAVYLVTGVPPQGPDGPLGGWRDGVGLVGGRYPDAACTP